MNPPIHSSFQVRAGAGAHQSGHDYAHHPEGQSLASCPLPTGRRNARSSAKRARAARRGRRPHRLDLVAVAVAAGGPAPRRRAAALSPPARSAARRTRTIEFYHRAPVLVARTTSRDSFANCFYGLYYIIIYIRVGIGHAAAGLPPARPHRGSNDGVAVRRAAQLYSPQPLPCSASARPCCRSRPCCCRYKLSRTFRRCVSTVFLFAASSSATPPSM